MVTQGLLRGSTDLSGDLGEVLEVLGQHEAEHCVYEFIW